MRGPGRWLTSFLATKTLIRLNQDYVDAFLKADVGWYREHLADDFVCIESDGSTLGRDEFLREAARGPDVATHTLAEVRVRVYGNTALVRCKVDMTNSTDGKSTTAHLNILHVWLKGPQGWQMVARQATRLTP